MQNSRMAIYDSTEGPSGSWRALTPADLVGGGGGGGDASAANQLALAAVVGTRDDAAWDGVAASPSVVAILKMIALNTESVVVP